MRHAPLRYCAIRGFAVFGTEGKVFFQWTIREAGGIAGFHELHKTSSDAWASEGGPDHGCEEERTNVCGGGV